MNKVVCKKCNYSDYNYKYDAEFCKNCDVWLINKCYDVTCDYCVNRPEKPSEVVDA
jgi:hypothetical protein